MNNWFLRVLSSSIGKKIVMAITGLLFCIFLFFHVIDNLMVYRGKEAFDGYVKSLHTFPILIGFIEICLIVLALIHIGFGIFLFFQNQKAKGRYYSSRKWAGGRTLSSSLMPYTGFYILGFIIFHLISLRFSIQEGKSIYELLSSFFSNPFYVAFYVFSMIVVALHIRHGFWSAFQSLGLNHPKYMPFIQKLSIIFALFTALCLGSVPIYFWSLA